jgi:hypothetical protein
MKFIITESLMSGQRPAAELLTRAGSLCGAIGMRTPPVFSPPAKSESL